MMDLPHLTMTDIYDSMILTVVVLVGLKLYYRFWWRP